MASLVRRSRPSPDTAAIFLHTVEPAWLVVATWEAMADGKQT